MERALTLITQIRTMDFQIKNLSSSGKGGTTKVCKQIQPTLHSLLWMHGKTVSFYSQVNTPQPPGPCAHLQLSQCLHRSCPSHGECRHNPLIPPACSPGTRVPWTGQGRLATFLLSVQPAAVALSLVHTSHANQAAIQSSMASGRALLDFDNPTQLSFFVPSVGLGLISFLVSCNRRVPPDTFRDEQTGDFSES